MIIWNEVTWYSKLLAIIFFIGVLPVLCFYVGVRYGEVNDHGNQTLILPEASPYQQVSNQEEIQYVIQDINGIKTPQIVNYSDAGIIQKINTYLADIANGAKCGEDVRTSSNNSFTTIMKVAYSKNSIFSVSIHSSYYCGGPHPTNDSNSSVTFDMETGNIVAFKDLFNNYERDKKSILGIIFEEQLKEEPVSLDNNSSCKGLYSSAYLTLGQKIDGGGFLFDYMNYVVEGDGITAVPSLAHVIQVCQSEGHISTDKLTPYLSENSLLKRVK